VERNLFRFIIRYSKRDQLLIVPLVLTSMVVYFLSLDLPKTIINKAIQGKGFPNPGSTASFLSFRFTLPVFLGGHSISLFHGFDLQRLSYLLALTMALLATIIINGWLKFQINTMKGWMGERMLRRLRYSLFDRVLRMPLPRFRRMKSAEIASMIRDEVEPLGGFVGEAFITPLLLGGQALTALIFILFQNAALGAIALGMVVMQAVLIPRMRRRLLVLARERQITGRQLAGRIAECVDGMVEIHAHDTSNFERADIAHRLGRQFNIRFEFYQRKFLVKFLNNFLSQVTPFVFYLLGGYLVIIGKLNLGALVAVIAAYKDLPSPVKELIDWDQQRLDVQIKYNQVVEQFAGDDLAPPEMQGQVESPQLPQGGKIVASNLSLVDDSGARIVDGVSFEVGLDEHVAIVGPHASGASELAQLLARLVIPGGGTVAMGGIDITRAPESVTGRAIGYVGPSSYLFPRSVRENLIYSLKHRPVGDAAYDGDAEREHAFQIRESMRTGTSLLDINAEWINYAEAGVSGPEELEAKIVEVLMVVDLDETIFELGLRSTADARRSIELAEPALRAREAMRERLASLGIQDWVERFDPARFNRNATLAENLLFGTPIGKTFDIDNLAKNAYVRHVLQETGLLDDMLRTGHKLAETMVELFSGLPPGHEFFERYSFIRHEDLPNVKVVLARAAEVGLRGLDEASRNELLGLPFKLISARHRLDLIDDAYEARILEARRYFAAHLPDDMKNAVELFDPARYNKAASLQDNVLFGKVVSGRAEAAQRVGALLRQVLDQLGLRPLVLRIGIDYQVGVGGARLSGADRQKVAMARAILKRPAVLILDQAEALLDPASQQKVVSGILGHCKSQGVVWVLTRAAMAERFGRVLVLDHGRLMEQGLFADLKCSGGMLHNLLKTD
jgi:putative ABC transport system ATP-binding protein